MFFIRGRKTAAYDTLSLSLSSYTLFLPTYLQNVEHFTPHSPVYGVLVSLVHKRLPGQGVRGRRGGRVVHRREVGVRQSVLVVHRPLHVAPAVEALVVLLRERDSQIRKCVGKRVLCMCISACERMIVFFRWTRNSGVVWDYIFWIERCVEAFFFWLEK